MSLETSRASGGVGDLERAARVVTSASPVDCVRLHYLNGTVLEVISTEETPVINVAGLSPAYASWVDRALSLFDKAPDPLESHEEVVTAVREVTGLSVAGASNRSVTLVPAATEPEFVAELVDSLEDALGCDRVISTERRRL